MKKLSYIIFALLISNQLYCQQWYSMGNIDTFAVNVYDTKYVPGITFYNNKITIGGDFKKDGSTVLNGIAQWSGYNWQPMGLGVWADNAPDSAGNGGNGMIMYHNNFYCGGIFGGAGGSFIDEFSHRARCIAKWNGNDWFPIKQPTDGFDNGVWRMGVYKNNLYVGGSFTHSYDTTGSHFTPGIARWNDTVFSAVATITSSYAPDVMVFANFNNKLIAGGWFETMDGTACNHIASYNDTLWSPLGNGFNSGVFALTVFNGELYAGGDFTSSQDGTTPLNHIAKWSGTQWIQVGEGLGDGIPFHDSVNVLCVDSVNNKLYAGGAFTQTGLGVPAKHLAEWTGSNWQEVGGGTNKEVWSLFSKNSNLYVGGQFTKVGSNIPAHLIACWGNNPTGVGEIKEENGVSIYPNPATNELKITSNELQLKEIKIYNVLGECVLVPPPSLQGGGQGVVNVSNLPSGIYFIQVTTAGTAGSPTGTAGSPQEKIIRKKFVKE